LRIAFVILAHRYPHQLLRLVKSLAHPKADCWIHLDKKCKIVDFKDVLEQKNVFAVHPTIKVNWGGIHNSEAMINSLQTVVAAVNEYDYFHFMSGQDYPLKPVEHFIQYLKENTGYDFVGNRPLEESQQNISMFKNYHFNDFKLPYKSIFERAANKILPQRKFPFDFEIRKGPQWMTLTKNAVEYCLNFICNNPSYLNYFQWTHIPDEFFFQTILYNSPLKSHLKNQIFHYIDWSEQKKNPKILLMADKEKLFASDLFFARKFDSSIDDNILNALDERMLALH